MIIDEVIENIDYIGKRVVHAVKLGLPLEDAFQDIAEGFGMSPSTLDRYWREVDGFKGYRESIAHLFPVDWTKEEDEIVIGAIMAGVAKGKGFRMIAEETSIENRTTESIYQRVVKLNRKYGLSPIGYVGKRLPRGYHLEQPDMEM